jgi:predicted RNase H-like HicB family nuclease
MSSRFFDGMKKKSWADQRRGGKGRRASGRPTAAEGVGKDASNRSLVMLHCRIMKWRVILEQDTETGDWAAWCPELPGCTSAGETEDEAMSNISEAIELYLEPDPIPMSPDAGNLAPRFALDAEILTHAATKSSNQPA